MKITHWPKDDRTGRRWQQWLSCSVFCFVASQTVRFPPQVTKQSHKQKLTGSTTMAGKMHAQGCVFLWYACMATTSFHLNVFLYVQILCLCKCIEESDHMLHFKTTHTHTTQHRRLQVSHPDLSVHMHEPAVLPAVRHRTGAVVKTGFLAQRQQQREIKPTFVRCGEGGQRAGGGMKKRRRGGEERGSIPVWRTCERRRKKTTRGKQGWGTGIGG